jgi:ATP-dependent Clp protease ATP-binding subunit ClpA
LKQILEDFEPYEVSGLSSPRQVSGSAFTLEVPSGQRNRLWQNPRKLRIHYYWWELPNGYFAARVPDLQFQLYAQGLEQLEEKLVRHSLMALRHVMENRSLEFVRHFSRTEKMEVVTIDVPYKAKTPVEMEEEESSVSSSSGSETVLQKTCTDLTREKIQPCWEMETLLEELGEIFTGQSTESALLVGGSGVGKTAVFGELYRSRDQYGMSGWKFFMTSGARLVSGQTGFGMWQDQCVKLVREVAGKKILIHFGNLLELIQSGRSVHNKRGIGSFLKESIQRGNLTGVAECTPEQLHLIEQEDPQLLAVFRVIRMHEPDHPTVHRILEKFATTYRPEVQPGPGALEKLEDLHRQFATYSVSPGRPLRFLRNLLDDLCFPRDGEPPGDSTVKRSGSGRNRRKQGESVPQRYFHAEEVTRAFSEETGLPLFMLEPLEPLDMNAARKWFEKRVIGQTLAINRVLDLLALAKAGLNRRQKPIGSLLFIGPTGVGKTELAKALAAFLFGSEDRMIRFDMGEFSDPMAHIRLIFSRGQEEGLLTARVREQPFSVILLDEFEKASPRVFDLLLQVLGEGRLTDAAGRVADFSNTVLIMTSNLGVKSYQTGSLGFGFSDRVDPVEHFTSEVKKFLRPEMFNRIDSIVPFGPLDRETVALITRMQLENIRWRDGLRGRGVDLRLEDDLVDIITRTGFDPRYGARPLKRCIESMILRPLASELTAQSPDFAMDVLVRVDHGEPASTAGSAGSVADGKVRFEIRIQTDENGQPVPSSRTRQASIQISDRCSTLRRKIRGMPGKGLYIATQSRLNRMQQLVRKSAADKSAAGAETRRDHEGVIRVIEALFREQEQLTAEVDQLESGVLQSIYSQQSLDEPDVQTRLLEYERRHEKFRRDLYRLSVTSHPDRVLLLLYGSDRTGMEMLLRGYIALAERLEFPVQFYFIRAVDGGDDVFFVPSHEPAAANVRAARLGDAMGVALEIEGPDAWLYFQPETGVHRISRGRNDPSCFVEASHGLPRIQGVQSSGRNASDGDTGIPRSFGAGEPGSVVTIPEGFGGRSFRPEASEVRKVQMDAGRLSDSLLGKISFSGDLSDELPDLIIRRLQHLIENQLTS